MSGKLFDDTKMAAYFLWESSGCENALNLWFCAEDMAMFFEQTDVLSAERVEAIRRLGARDAGYVHFVQHLAFRIYIYTNREDEETNWFAAERLLANGEWVSALTGMAATYRCEKTNKAVMNDVRSENVRAFYDKQTFHTS